MCFLARYKEYMIRCYMNTTLDTSLYLDLSPIEHFSISSSPFHDLVLYYLVEVKSCGKHPERELMGKRVTTATARHVVTENHVASALASTAPVVMSSPKRRCRLV